MWLTNCADPSTRLQSPTREGCWLQSSSVHHTIKIEKLLGYKTLQCTNTVASSQERRTRANSVSGHSFLEQTLLNTCATCVTFDGPSNNPFICLGLWEKKTQTYNHELNEKQSWKTELHKPRQIPYLSSCYWATGWNSYSSLNRLLAIEL